MREDGYFKVTGRAKDMIIRGGENVYPREIEEFLYTNPKVAEVHVTGLPDERLGEAVLAWIKLKAGRDATAGRDQSVLQRTDCAFQNSGTLRFVDRFPLR